VLAVHRLLQLGAPADSRDEGGWQPLHHACMHSSRVDLVRLLVGAGASVNAKTPDMDTPFHFACCRGSANIVECLLPQADLLAANQDGMNGLLLAIAYVSEWFHWLDCCCVVVVWLLCGWTQGRSRVFLFCCMSFAVALFSVKFNSALLPFSLSLPLSSRTVFGFCFTGPT
jgi:hypothetical protein